MIAHLRGTLLEKHPNLVIVETGGVGYELMVPVSTFTALPPAGGQVALRVHTHVREDVLALYGFATAEEKSLFERLISVSGIGPRLAVTVLSGLPVEDLIQAIRGGQIEHLVRIPGVGKKTAERIVVELRDKLELLAPARGAIAEAGPEPGGIERDVLSALVNLGCQRAMAETAIRKARAAGAPLEFEPLFRRAMEFIR
ncbi:MAG: Holliday junction branch migration protein RuvA [Bryobacteraceae bacterium]